MRKTLSILGLAIFGLAFSSSGFVSAQIPTITPYPTATATEPWVEIPEGGTTPTVGATGTPNAAGLVCPQITPTGTIVWNGDYKKRCAACFPAVPTVTPNPLQAKITQAAKTATEISARATFRPVLTQSGINATRAAAGLTTFTPIPYCEGPTCGGSTVTPTVIVATPTPITSQVYYVDYSINYTASAANWEGTRYGHAIHNLPTGERLFSWEVLNYTMTGQAGSCRVKAYSNYTGTSALDASGTLLTQIHVANYATTSVQFAPSTYAAWIAARGKVKFNSGVAGPDVTGPNTVDVYTTAIDSASPCNNAHVVATVRMWIYGTGYQVAPTSTPTRAVANDCSIAQYSDGKPVVNYKGGVIVGRGCYIIIPAIKVTVPFNDALYVDIKEVRFCFDIYSFPSVDIWGIVLPLSVISIAPAAWFVRRLFNM